MKFAGARGITRSRVPLIAMLALAATIGLAGCEGDDGKDGTDGTNGLPGAPGATGPTGPAGPTGPTGPVAGIEKPLESCNVCHGDNSLAAVADNHVLPPEVNVTDVQFSVSGADLVISYKVTVDGVAGTGFATVLRSDYRFDGVERRDLSDDGTPVTLAASATAGSYTATIAGGAAYGNSRYLIRFATSDDRDTRITGMVVGDYPASPHDDVLASGACANCHGLNANGNWIHGSGYDYPLKAENCTVCHKAENSAFPNVPYVMIGHSIHNSHNMPDGKFELTLGTRTYEWETTFPSYMTNCSICHAGQDNLDVVNEMPVSYAGCMSCHGDMSSWEETWAAKPDLDFHASYDDTIVCTQCHTASALPDLDTVAEMHNGLETERVGIIWNGEDTSVSEGAKFNWNITGIVDDGTNLKITWTAEYPKGTPVNPCNETVTATAPGFFPYGPNTANEGSISVLRSYVQGDDYVLGQASGPGQASSVTLSKTNTVCSGNTATTTIAVDAGIAAGTRGVLALQGKPTIPVPAGFADSLHAAEWPYTTMFVRVPTPVQEWIVGSSGLVPVADQRRKIADTGQCLKCHVGSLYQHGNNRVDNVTLCVMCHNSASIDQNNRVTMGVDASEAYDGLVGQTYEFKTLLHALHTVDSGFLNPAAKTTAIYRTRGIYAWAPEGVTPPNWGTPACEKTNSNGSITYGNVVFGATDPTADVACQPHYLYHPTFPRAANDCAACHYSDFDAWIVDQTQGVATTLDGGAAPWNNQLDDVLKGPTSAACNSCHKDAASVGHANQNSWVPTTFPDGRQTIIDAAK